MEVMAGWVNGGKECRVMTYVPGEVHVVLVMAAGLTLVSPGMGARATNDPPGRAAAAPARRMVVRVERSMLYSGQL